MFSEFLQDESRARDVYLSLVKLSPFHPGARAFSGTAGEEIRWNLSGIPTGRMKLDDYLVSSTNLRTRPLRKEKSGRRSHVFEEHLTPERASSYRMRWD